MRVRLEYMAMLGAVLLACGPTKRDDRGRDDPTPKPDAGHCEGITCGAGCCADGLACVAGVCQACTPSCGARVCGDDGCGGTCGVCAEGGCDTSGQCVSSCTPACDGRSCGDDGCGGACGSCPMWERCIAETGQCLARQPRWTRIETASLDLAFASATFDPASHQIMVFGGETNAEACRGDSNIECVLSNDMWTFGGIDWTAVTPTTPTRPQARLGVAMAWDPGSNRAVMHGGLALEPVFGIGETLSDAWEWKRGTSVWTSIEVTDSLTANAHAMVSSAAGEFRLFGGSDGSAYTNRTATLQGTTMTVDEVSNAPSARGDFASAWHPVEQRLYVFGGLDNADGLLDETWYLEDDAWHELEGTGPAARLGARMLYDPQEDRLLLFGGCVDEHTFSDLWQLEDGQWTQFTPLPGATPPARCQHVFQRTTFGGFILAGGLDVVDGTFVSRPDTWRLTFE